MNNNYKYLIWSGTAALIMLTAFLFVSAGHLAETATTTNMVSFSGEGRIFAKPDIAAISFSIVTEATTSKAAQNANSHESKKIVDFLKSQGIDEKDIKTIGYNIYPQYKYPRPVPVLPRESGSSYPPEYYDSNPKISGYQVNQSFEIKVRDLDKVSAVLDGLVTAGANQINHLGFRVDDIEKVQNEARTQAIKDAKMKAGDLKKKLGIRLGRIINYSEGGGYPPYLLEARALAPGGAGGDIQGPSVPPGENEIVVNVIITYQIR